MKSNIFNAKIENAITADVKNDFMELNISAAMIFRFFIAKFSLAKRKQKL